MLLQIGHAVRLVSLARLAGVTDIRKAVAARMALLGDLMRYRPWETPEGRSPQRDFHAAALTTKQRVMRGGNKSGKTIVACVDAWLAACGEHPAQRAGNMRKPPIHVWVSALDYEAGIADDVWPAFQMFEPTGMIRSRVYIRAKEPQIPRVITLRNGSSITFKSAENGPRKYRGTPIDYLLLNEEHPPEIVTEARRGLVSRAGHLVVAATPVESMLWLRDLEDEPTTVTIRSSMRDAARAGIADAKAVEEFLASLPPSQRAMREAGDYTTLEGLVYKEFNRATHVGYVRGDGIYHSSTRLAPWPIPAGWPRAQSIDFGTSHACAVTITARDPFNGRLWVYRTFYRAHVSPSTWATHLRAEPTWRTPFVADHDSGARSELELKGLRTEAASKGPGSVEAGIMVVQRWLWQRLPDGHPRVMLVNAPSERHDALGRCDGVGDDRAGLMWEMERYKYPDKKAKAVNDPADKPVKKDDHGVDSLRYLIVDLDRPRGRGVIAPVEDVRVNPLDDARWGLKRR